MQSINIKTAMKWLTAEQALKFLGVRSQTLYANVSRGRIRAKPDPADPRRSLYNGNDVARLAERRAGRRSAETVASQAIGWGDPVLRVRDLHDRERTALVPRSGCRGACRKRHPGRGRRAPLADLGHAPACRSSGAKSAHAGTPIGLLLSVASERAAIDPPSRGRSPAVLKCEAELLFGRLLEASLGTVTARLDLPVHTRLAKAWRKPQAQDILRRTLVLLADHELNASTFAVRVAASTGASLSACLLAGLATLTGPLHGGAARALSSLLDAARQTSANEAVREWLGRGEPLPAFGHPLYPGGDLRAIALMRHFKLSGMFLSVRTAAEDLTGEPPNVDFALAALADAYDLPKQAPFVIFALSRSVGWIAHALEQIAAGQLIRPRARYVGPALAKEHT